MTERVEGSIALRRECGNCCVCCLVFLIPDLNKARGQLCPHVARWQPGKEPPGRCSLHGQPRPPECGGFSCTWALGGIFGGELGEERPDRAGYMIATRDYDDGLVVGIYLMRHNIDITDAAQYILERGFAVEVYAGDQTYALSLNPEPEPDSEPKEGTE